MRTGGTARLGRDIGRGAGAFLSLPCLRNVNFLQFLGTHNCGERVPGFVFGRTWPKDVSRRPATLPGPLPCAHPAPRPEAVVLLQAISEGGEAAWFPGRDFAQTAAPRSSFRGCGAEGVEAGGQEKRSI